jgi:hypothetical protein
MTTKKDVVPRPYRGTTAGFGSNSIAGEAMEYSFFGLLRSPQPMLSPRTRGTEQGMG